MTEATHEDFETLDAAIFSDRNYGHVAPTSLVSLLSTTGFSCADSDVLRQELQLEHVELHAAAAAADASWRQQG